MQSRYKFIIILIVLLSISSISATNLDNNYTSTNEKSIINDISNFNKIDNQIDNNYNNTKSSDNYDDDSSNDKIYNNESSYNEISDNKTYDNEISDNNDSSSLKAPSSNSNITYSYNEILICANKTNNFIKENHYIPAVVKIGNKNVTINDYLHLLCKSINSTTSQSINTTKYVMSTTGTNCHNMKISKKDYLSLADSIVKCYNINLRNPLKISIYNNTLSFDDAVHFFTKIISWKYTHNGALLGSEVVIALYNYDYSKEENALITTTTQPFTINATYTKISNETYELTLTPSETCTIYYTRNGTTPTTKDKIYTSPLTIYNSTWIQYYGVNKNNQKTPILSFGIHRPATAYITNKPQQKNQYEKIVNIATSKKSTIYYTINGTKPTTESTKYTKPITINNYTILQYFSITQEGKKSSTYYYKIQDPTPYTTIINKTEVQDNHQIVIVIANKPGTIYYTRNGTIPTTQSKKYTPGTEMNLSIKTELRTILEDKKGQQSIVNFYKAPQIMTPPITIITPKTMLVNNKQTIQFTTNMANSTIYYTTDNTNPKNSTTRKTTKTGNQITINKNTKLKYYTENDGYHSEVYTYIPPESNNQRPTIAVYNTTRMYSNGEQRIMIQSNQPGTIYYTICTKTETPITNEYTDEITINKDQKIQVYAENTENTKKSKMIEYTIQNKSKTIMNYTYTIQTSNTYPEHYIKFTFNNQIYTMYPQYFIDKIPLTRNLYIDTENNEIHEYYQSSTINQPGILISMGRKLNITYYDILYGETNYVNVIYSSATNGTEDITLFSNYKKLITLTIIPATNQNETITTEFKTNNNIITKSEKLTYTPQMTSNCGQYDLLQTYILTNNIITSNKLNTTMDEIDQLYINDTADYIFRITPQDRTIIEGVMFLAMMHSYSDYVAQKLNTTRIITDEVMCMVGIENSRMNYIHYNDPLVGMTIKDDTNIIMFNMYQSMFSYNCAKFVLNTVKYNIATTTLDEIIGLLKLDSKVKLLLDNETGILEMYSNLTGNVSMVLDLKTGIMTYILRIGGFEYKGAITENLTSDIINQTNKNKAPSNYCFEDILSSDFIDKTKNLFGIPLDSGWVELEGIVGGILIDFGSSLAIGGISTGVGSLIGLGMMLAGIFLCADANGWTTDLNNMSRAFNTGLDLGLTFVPGPSLPKPFRVFEIATENEEIFYNAGRIGKSTYITLRGFDEAQSSLYGEAMEKITVDPFRNTMQSYLSDKKI